MFTELLTAAMINPDFEKLNLIATAVPNEQKTKVQRTISKQPYAQNFVFPLNNNTGIFNKTQMINKYKAVAESVVNDFAKRKNSPDQFLKWVDLPAQQLAIKGKVSYLDEIYEQAGMLKNSTNRPLVILGIGGSKHTAEFLLNMCGVGNKGKVYFYSDIDPISFENFMNEVKTPIENLNFLVVSKSGTTFETKDGFVRFENMLFEYYKSQGMDEESAFKEAQKHFAICTDKTASQKNLRGKIGHKNGQDNNYIKELYIHDGVGGRFSMFDDAGLFAIAYAGVSKDIAKRILLSAENASNKCLSTDINNNPAAKSAIFNVYTEQFGFKIKQQQYFGHLFEVGGENWIKQLYLESLKDFDFSATKAPDSMHYASEGFFYPANRSKYHVVMTVMNPEISANYKKYVDAITQSYAEKVPVELEVLDTENNAIKPEAIGEYIQTKHFEIVYTGMLRRAVKIQEDVHLPEVFQSHVEVYKNKFKPGSQYELAPGK